MALPRAQALIVNQLKLLGYLNSQETNQLLQSANEITGQELEKLLIDDYKLTEFQLLIAKSKAFDLSPFWGKHFRPTEQIFEWVDQDFCLENEVLPIGKVGDAFVIAISNPFDLQSVKRTQEVTKLRVIPLLGLKAEIVSLLKVNGGSVEGKSSGFGDVVDALNEEYGSEVDVNGQSEVQLAEDSSPVVQLANKIVEEACYAGASDIHIEPMEDRCRVRYRIDGVCRDKIVLPKHVAAALVTRYKVMADLDIAEKRIPQDGRIIFKHFTRKGVDLDLRISTSPMSHGEGLVMRLLDKNASMLPLKALGFEEENLGKYRQLIKQPYGMILHCGPTGSGKSMSLYSAISEINTADIVVRTVEDPIEYTLPGLCQVQTNRKIGLTFAMGLRAFLRQDPDVILVGEIRDKETASIAVEAALTGHLLFSTLHTNDAASAIPRLIEMGIEPFMLSASLLCVCAQRLMRRLCKNCKQMYEPTGREKEILLRAIGWSGPIYGPSGTGCTYCGRTGYKGRVGTHELMVIDEAIMKEINKGASAEMVKRAAVMGGMKTLHQDSMRKVQSGVTSMAEAIATIAPDVEDLDAIIEESILQEEVKKQLAAERRQKIQEIREFKGKGEKGGYGLKEEGWVD